MNSSLESAPFILKRLFRNKSVLLSQAHRRTSAVIEDNDNPATTTIQYTPPTSKGRKDNPSGIDPLHFLLQLRLCSSDWQARIWEANTPSHLQWSTTVSSHSGILHLVGCRNVTTLRRYEGRSARQTSRNVSLFPPLLLPSSLDSYLSGLPPRNHISIR